MISTSTLHLTFSKYLQSKEYIHTFISNLKLQLPSSFILSRDSTNSSILGVVVADMILIKGLFMFCWSEITRNYLMNI